MISQQGKARGDRSFPLIGRASRTEFSDRPTGYSIPRPPEPTSAFARTPRDTFVLTCLRGALPPVDLRAVCLVRAIVDIRFELKGIECFFVTVLHFFFPGACGARPRLALIRISVSAFFSAFLFCTRILRYPTEGRGAGNYIRGYPRLPVDRLDDRPRCALFHHMGTIIDSSDKIRIPAAVCTL